MAPIPDDSLKRKLEDVRRFGTQSLSYSVLQDGMKTFRHPAFEGFIAYLSVWGTDFCLSDPITPQKDFILATKLFLEQAKSAVFCQISNFYAQQLSSLNFTINGFGVEHVVNLDDFVITWKKRKNLKSSFSSFTKKDFIVGEHLGILNEVKNINDEWLRNKSRGRELRFMARPFVHLLEEDVRYFYLIKDHRILGFCSFDPVYSNQMDGQIVSYALQHLRVSNQSPSGAQDFLVLNALAQFKDEEFKKISLGLSPLYQRENLHFRFSRFTESLFSFFYQTNLQYNFRSLGEHKEQYKVEKKQVYIATKGSFSLLKLSGLLKVNHLI